jgi:hypothetical protein
VLRPIFQPNLPECKSAALPLSQPAALPRNLVRDGPRLRTHATATSFGVQTQALLAESEENHLQSWSCEPRVELGAFRIRVQSVTATLTRLVMWIREREFEIGHNSGAKRIAETPLFPLQNGDLFSSESKPGPRRSIVSCR